MTLAASAAAAAAFKRLRILFERRQGVGDILKGGQNGAAVLFGRLSIGRLRGALLMQQSSALKNRRRDVRAQAPKSGARREQLIHGRGRAAGVGGQQEIGKPVGGGDADLGAGVMQVGFGLQHIGTLRHEFRRQADRQILRQLQARQLKFLIRGLIRKAAGQNRQKIVCLGQLLEERRQGRGDLCELGFLRSQIQTDSRNPCRIGSAEF